MTLSDTINRMIDKALRSAKITSASPGHTNFVEDILDIENPDIEGELKKIVEKTQTSASRKQKDVNDKVELFEEGNVGKIQQLSSQQFSNVQQFARNPFQFFFANIFKRFAKGAGVLLLAGIILEAVKFIIGELFKSGRLLDRTFKRKIRNEILLFNSEREQAELRQGFRSVIITTIPFLRGDQVRGQISGNLYNPTAIPMNRLDPRRVIAPNPRAQGSRNAKFFNRRNSRFG